jgi:hypothetical protein
VSPFWPLELRDPKGDVILAAAHVALAYAGDAETMPEIEQFIEAQEWPKR